jgi:hypothetical protein
VIAVENRYRIKMLLHDGSWATLSRSREEDLNGLSREEAEERVRELVWQSEMAGTEPNCYDFFVL